ncbi:DUF1501 domain-containing protein, partial [Akkermansiaceae bacterium]|nr:DUF1501 domain-containing protein [Akkermansiaceae bacterium]
MISEPPLQQDVLALSSSQRRFLWGCLGILIGLRLCVLIYFPFTDTTEARYAEIARKMVETNDWVTPQFDYGVPFWGKPPLHTWVSALGMKAFGVNEFGGRIFTYGTGLVLLTLLYQWVRQERGKNIALVGTVILTSSSLFFISMATVMTELVMITGTGLSMLAFWNSLHHARRRTLMGYLFFVGLAIGLLAKGPVAFVLTAIPIGVWVLLHNRWSETWEKLPWISGTLLMIAIAAPWYFLAEIKTPGFLRYFIVGEHFERFLVSGWEGDLYGAGHAKPKGTIWIMWLGTLFPWTPLLLLPLLRFKSVLSGIKQEKSKWSSYLICWTLAPLAFFSMATNVLPTYVITGLPACCFLLVEFWTHSHPKQTGPSSGSIRYFKSRDHQRAALDALASLNDEHARKHPEHADLAARMESYELAYRMQMEVPEVVDLDGEPEHVREMYGMDNKVTHDFGRQCLMARRLVEKGVRFVQIFAGGWDSHDYLERGHSSRIAAVDKPVAALIRDLKQRGMLDDTLVIWSGEFGRT